MKELSSGNHFGTKFSYIPFCFIHTRVYNLTTTTQIDYGAQLLSMTSDDYKIDQAVLEGKRNTLSSSHGHEFSFTDRHETQLNYTFHAFWQIAKQQQIFCNKPINVDNMRVFGFLIYKLYYMDSPYIHKAKGMVNLSFRTVNSYYNIAFVNSEC